VPDILADFNQIRILPSDFRESPGISF